MSYSHIGYQNQEQSFARRFRGWARKPSMEIRIKIGVENCSRSCMPMTLDELRTHLLALSPQEKAEAVQLLVQSLSDVWTGIEKTPGVVGGDACIAGTRIPVWDLVQYRRLGASDAKILEAYPQLTATDLAHAWSYAEARGAEIEAAIQQNEAA